MKTWRFAITAFVLFCMIFSLPGGAMASRPSVVANAAYAGGERLTGWLSLVWRDGPPGDKTMYEPLYMLATGRGETIYLETMPGDLQTQAALQALDRQRVTVEGHWSLSRAPALAASLTVFQVQMARLAAGASPTAPPVTGHQPWVTILCKFADIATEPKPLSYFQDMYGNAYPELDHYWRELSYNNIDLEGSGASGWYTLPYSRSYYVADEENPSLDLLKQDCTTAADPYVYYPNYEGVNLAFNGSLGCCALGGAGFMDLDGVGKSYRMTWLPPWGYTSIGVIEHEMGHGFGLPHSSGQYGATYDNYWDVMSFSGICSPAHPTYECLGQHTVAPQKNRVGWLQASEIFTATLLGRTTIPLERLALPQTTNYKMAIIPVPNSANYYTLEARRRVGHDAVLLLEGVILHYIDAGYIYVIDIDNNGFTGDDGAAWTVGETFIDTTNAISFTVQADTGSGYQVTIELAPPPVFTTCADQIQIPESECLALLAFYQDTGGASWTDHTGWLVSPGPCTWKGVGCIAGHVDNLNLGSNNLSGSLPPEIDDLAQLRSLWLNGNDLSGSIPAEIGNLGNLEGLSLDYNNLSGVIPTQSGNLASLRWLSLRGNNLSGSIPAEVGNLGSLEWLFLGENELSGPIPSQLGNLPNLEMLLLNNNQLSGSIPYALANLPKLGYLAIDNNQLSGSIPTQLGDLSQLILLGLSGNQLVGSIPPELANLALLDYLNLSSNHLSGSLPASIGNMQNLLQLQVNHNQLSGSIPPELGSVTQLQYLRLDANQFEGEIPASLVSLVHMNDLNVGYNKLYASDSALLAFLSSKDPDWAQTQTVPPTDLLAGFAGDAVQLSWTPIAYTGDGGYYEISYAYDPAGPYTVHGVTADKFASSYLVDGLTPGATSYLRLRTYTPAHDDQQNDLWSDYSAPVGVSVSNFFLPLVVLP